MGKHLKLAVLRPLIRLLAWLYPLGIWLLQGHMDFKALGLILFSLLSFDLLVGLDPPRRRWTLLGMGCLLALMAAVNPAHIVRLYPFLMSTSVLYLFASSQRPEDNPMLGPMRRFKTGDAKFLQLLHSAKWIWILGLSLNSFILFVFLFSFDTRSWALYASVYSYVLLLGLFLSTLLYIGLQRKRCK